MASLPPEQQPIAEQVLRGGIPAVRTALHLEREKAVAAGRPAPNTDQLIAMAESLLPRLKAAEWHDRAEAAAKDVDEISLRDLRSVVAAADAARDDETRALAATLRDALARRVEEMRQAWSERSPSISTTTGWCGPSAWRPVRPSRPPRLDPELTERLNDAAGQAMSPDTPSDRWLALLDAVAASPVRRSVKPAGLPSDPSPELRKAAHQQSGRIPALAAMLGVTIPPPPVAATSRRRSRPPQAAAAGAGDLRTAESTGGGAGDEEPLLAEPQLAFAEDETLPPAEAVVPPGVEHSVAAEAPAATAGGPDAGATDVPGPTDVPAAGGPDAGATDVPGPTGVQGADALDLPEAQDDPVLVEELGEPLGER